MASPVFPNGINLLKTEIQNAVAQNLGSAPGSPVEGQYYGDTALHQFGYYTGSGWVYFGSGSGTVTSVSVVSANGFNGSVATATSTPAITITTTITGLLKGNGTAISAASAGTDYVVPAGSVATLTTPRAIYGNNFDGSAALAQIIASTYGGTGNGFTKFSGPASTEKTFTLPNASDTLVAYGTAGSFTGVQTFGAAGNVGKLAIAGTTSGSTILNATAVASGTLTLPAATDILVGKATTDIFTNKTFDAAGTGNALSNIATSMFATNIVDTDTSLTANSDTRLASQKAVKAYVDTKVTGLLDYQGAIDASSNPNFPSALKGDVYRISVAGKIGGASGTVVQAGDEIIANTDNAGGTLASVGTSWDIIQANVLAATTSVGGYVVLASAAEAEAKTDIGKALTAISIANYGLVKIATIGDNTTTALVVTDNLTIDKVAICRNASTNIQAYPDITYAANTTTFTFAVAPATNAYKVVIIGI